MRVLFLHGFNADTHGTKASHLRREFGASSVIEPPDPGLPYCRTACKPILLQLAAHYRGHLANIVRLTPDGIGELVEVAPGLKGLFDRSVAIAQELYDHSQPDVIVGSSLGGGVAMSMDTGLTPMVLVDPVWNRDLKAAASDQRMHGATGMLLESFLPAIAAELSIPLAHAAGLDAPDTVKPQTVILHSRHDEVFDIANSSALLRNSPIPPGHAMQQAIGTIHEAGYANTGGTACCRGYNDGRLIVIGRNHQNNEPDPSDDGFNANPDPLGAMVFAVKLLAQAFRRH